jgi:hypothetical protein
MDLSDPTTMPVVAGLPLWMVVVAAIAVLILVVVALRR